MVKSFLKYLQYEKRYSQHTITSYSTDLSQFEKFLNFSYPGIKIKESDHKIIREWLVSLMEENNHPALVMDPIF